MEAVVDTPAKISIIHQELAKDLDLKVVPRNREVDTVSSQRKLMVLLDL